MKAHNNRRTSSNSGGIQLRRLSSWQFLTSSSLFSGGLPWKFSVHGGKSCHDFVFERQKPRFLTQLVGTGHYKPWLSTYVYYCLCMCIYIYIIDIYRVIFGSVSMIHLQTCRCTSWHRKSRSRRHDQFWSVLVSCLRWYHKLRLYIYIYIYICVKPRVDVIPKLTMNCRCPVNSYRWGINMMNVDHRKPWILHICLHVFPM